MAENSIPADLILNWDQRGMRMVPVNDRTMKTRGSKRVSVTDLSDKRDTFLSNKCQFLKWLNLDLYSCTTTKEEYYEKCHSEASRTNYTNV